MTTSFSVDANNDLYLDAQGNLAISSGLQAVLEVCQQVCQTQLGELFLDINAGIPTFQTIWSGSPNVVQFEAAIKQAILSVPDVIGILSMSMSQTGDTFAYEAAIQTIYGQGVINGQL